MPHIAHFGFDGNCYAVRSERERRLIVCAFIVAQFRKFMGDGFFSK
jgi:hypothetical protein